MVQLTYLLLICIVVPLIFMLFLLERKSRLVIGFMIVGIFMSVLAGELNTVVYVALNSSKLYATITYTPIIEEFLKGLPVFYCLMFISDKKETLLSVSMAVGIGFAIFENIGIIMQNSEVFSLENALIRGFSAALVHGVCSATIGYGLSFVNKRKKLAITGTFGLFTVAVTYHAIYNALIQSDFTVVACVLPLLTYTPLVVWYFKNKSSKSKKEQQTTAT